MRIERIDDPRDPRLDDYHAARNPLRRRAGGMFVVESALLVRRLLTASRFRARSVLATSSALEALHDALEAAPEDLVAYAGSPDLLAALLGFKFHRGCLAVAERGPDLDTRTLVAPHGPRTLLVLEDVGDPDNVGALFRDARAFGVAAVLLSPGVADPLYPKAIRASAGAALAVPFATLDDWPAALAGPRQSGYTVVALATDGERDIAEAGAALSETGRVALLVGSEGRGLSAAARAAAQMSVRIAMAPGTDSLNVAVAAGIALHRLALPPGA